MRKRRVGFERKAIGKISGGTERGEWRGRTGDQRRCGERKAFLEEWGGPATSVGNLRYLSAATSRRGGRSGAKQDRSKPGLCKEEHPKGVQRAFYRKEVPCPPATLSRRSEHT